MTVSSSTAPDSRGQPEPHEHHVVSPRVLLTVFASLLVLTAVTVAVTYLELGALDVAVALGVATAKATLVGLYFMHLRYDNRFFAVVLVASLLAVGLFIAITLMDTRAYGPEQVPAAGPPAGSTATNAPRGTPG